MTITELYYCVRGLNVLLLLCSIYFCFNILIVTIAFSYLTLSPTILLDPDLFPTLNSFEPAGVRGGDLTDVIEEDGYIDRSKIQPVPVSSAPNCLDDSSRCRDIFFSQFLYRLECGPLFPSKVAMR